MSKNRNRSIQQEITQEHFPSKWFGEYVLLGTNPTSNSVKKSNNTAIYGEIVDTLDNLSVSKSSSSSLSWGEDCEIESTQKVKNEYDKMNNILCGLEPIPPHYDRDEYKLWIRTFPSLRLTKVERTPNILKNSRNRDNLESSLSKGAVIDKLLNKMCDTLVNPTNEAAILDKRKKSQHKQLNIKNNTNKNTLQDDFSTLLRISPAPTYERPSLNLEKRRRSMNYVSIMSSADLHSREFTSLPHLPAPNNSFLNSKIKNSDMLKRKSRKRQYTNKIVLPPIDVTNQFRSISAIPLQQTKCSSALSTKTNFIIGCNNAKDIVCNSSVNKRKLKGFY